MPVFVLPHANSDMQVSSMWTSFIPPLTNFPGGGSA